MKNFLYVIAIILVVVWAIGFFIIRTGGITHILLALALFAVSLRIIHGINNV
jgi:hypothetical protein